MKSQKTSFRRFTLIVAVGVLLGWLVVSVSRQGSVPKAWEATLRVANEAALTIGAAIPYTETARRVRENRENHDKWRTLNLTTYAYELQTRCLCATVGRAIVKIEDGVVASVMDVETGEYIYAGDLRLYPTIDGLFQFVRKAIRYRAERFEVSYDSDTGVPISAKYDYRLDIMDDEMFFAARLLPVKVNQFNDPGTTR